MPSVFHLYLYVSQVFSLLFMIGSAMQLDMHDLKILEVLQTDGRISVSDLARRINLSSTPCAQRLRKLEMRGFISGYKAIVDPNAVKLDLLVFIQVTLKETDENTLQSFNSAIGRVPNVLECHMVGGDFDYLLKARVTGMNEYRKLLGGEIGSLPMVQGTHSYFVMEEVKDGTALPLKPVRVDGKK
ncbi:Lrp/AsnC ligand binding domain-containing protein [Anderseniella sp. Alg231-50]|uniref:Lrp/AsnC ligand binding domain-containing protein n=1 Tax=Anderseniella sp. Alg231-50 TaxID=1922226 RepID=UPI00307BBCFD